jgi:hypothetical protein
MRTSKALFCAAFTLCMVAACAGRGTEPKVEGRLASGGGYLGEWDFYPKTCAPQGDGVVLTEEGSEKRRLVLVDRNAASNGTRAQRIEVHMQGDTPNGNMDILLGDAKCVTSILHPIADRFDGALRVDCETGEGGRVVGTVSFQNCPRWIGRHADGTPTPSPFESIAKTAQR